MIQLNHRTVACTHAQKNLFGMIKYAAHACIITPKMLNKNMISMINSTVDVCMHNASMNHKRIFIQLKNSTLDMHAVANADVGTKLYSAHADKYCTYYNQH